MPDDDFQIEIGETVRRHILRRSNPLSDSTKTVVAYDSPDKDLTPVFVSDQVMRRMERQALSDKEHEIGGVLLGGFYRNDDGAFVEITDYVEAMSAKGTDVSLTFTHETWEYIHSKIAQLGNENVQIVGWYHSHPALGIFMSKDDEFIHSSYFAEPWHVAIVHDPIYTNWGCFKWADGELERAGGFYICADKSRTRQVRDYLKNQLATRQAPPRSASSNADRLIRPTFVGAASIWIAILVMLLIQITAGWLVLSKLRTGAKADDYKTAIQMLEYSNLSGAQEHLRRELSAHPGNTRAYRDLLAVDRALSSPATGGFKNENLDRQNMILALGDELAKSQNGKAKDKEPLHMKENGSEFLWGNKGMPDLSDSVGGDPLKMVLNAYIEAAATRAERISRAKAINAAAKTSWSRRALQWLEEEDFRQIAYGKQIVPLEYQKQYKNLPNSKKAIVDRVLGSKR